ncbi:nucleotidyltransferase domain-containing protein [Actinoplanes couchii]|uniref:Polymerase nucleotidyl transferase domain-containing protein n=1 Tax=Actinoplanes couchii TaxID=403638 RepID=A0ABQ3XRI4_9ACTN|nr:nucleotidyltransferase domain-containing protein [Actinoplanes couchii]MDR6321469.1 hypothetical protein [Actinoplanes couchii]GID61123.1 hypothetical protein Aco03nite_095270 [Actinoplanes couchii]
MTADHGARLRAAGERLAEEFKTVAGVRSVLLTGSVARGVADRWSDVELLILWEDAPSPEARHGAASRAGGEVSAFHDHDPDNAEWSEDVLLDRAEVQVSHRIVAEVDTWIADVLERADPALVKQDLIALLRDAVVLHDTGPVAGWVARTEVYPEALALAMVGAHLDFRSSWQRRRLLARGDLLPLAEDLLDTARNVLLVLLGLNRVWFPHLGFKGMSRVAEALPLAPPALPARLDALFTATPASAVPAADALISETLILVAKNMPAANALDELAHLGRERF